MTDSSAQDEKAYIEAEATHKRKMFEIFSQDERTKAFRLFRMYHEKHIEDACHEVRKVQKCETPLTYEAIQTCKEAMLRALQTRAVFDDYHNELKGEFTYIMNSIRENLDNRLDPALAYIQKMNQWVALLEGAPAAKPDKPV